MTAPIRHVSDGELVAIIREYWRQRDVGTMLAPARAQTASLAPIWYEACPAITAPSTAVKIFPSGSP